MVADTEPGLARSETRAAIATPARRSLLQRLEAAGGRPTGFDYLRLCLAIGVVCIHAPLTSYGADLFMWTSPSRPLVRIILPMFFALSGYLVAGSLIRSSSLLQFLALRGIRIYPALCLEVVLSALVIGPWLTSLDLHTYFHSPLFSSYLLNATGDIHYRLPGLFLQNPYRDTVNSQLWTIPFELMCYIAISFLALIGLKKRRWIGPASIIILTLGYAALKIQHAHGLPAVIIGRVSGLFLVTSFLAGVSLFFYSDVVPWSVGLCVASGLISLALIGIVPNGDYIVAPFAGYFTVSLGLMNPRRLAILRGADYSYGIYLYGFVIQQVLMNRLPWARVWWLNLLLSLPTAAAVAAFSWHLVEKPALRLKRHLPGRLHFTARSREPMARDRPPSQSVP